MNNNFIENSPITPGIDGKKIKTFEELLDEKLAKEECDLKTDTDQEIKRPYLKKGTGLIRFQNGLNKNNIHSDIDEKRHDTSLQEISQDNKINNKRNVFSNSNRKINSLKPTTKQDLSDLNKITLNSNTSNKYISNKTKVEARNQKNCIKGKSDIVVLKNQLQDHVKSLNQEKNKKVIPENQGNIGDEEINNLKLLLKKIECKKDCLEDELNEANNWVDVSDNESNSSIRFRKKNKKKINKSNKNRMNFSKVSLTSDLSKEFNNSMLNEPSISGYTLSLKKQISYLENKLDQLKNNCASLNTSTKQNIDKKSNPDIDDLKIMLQTLNDRLKNVEYHYYKNFSNKNTVKKDNKPEKSNIQIIQHKPDVNVTKYENYTLYDFSNGDTMKIMDDNTIIYNYSDSGINQITYPDGLKVINFPDGQIEKIHKNGVKHILYPNGLQRIINPNGSEEVHMQDGTILRVYSNGNESLEFPNGDREIRTNLYQRREYVDGTVKTIYSDGTQETRFINGRLRIKDKFGNLVVDSNINHLNEIVK